MIIRNVSNKERGLCAIISAESIMSMSVWRFKFEFSKHEKKKTKKGDYKAHSLVKCRLQHYFYASSIQSKAVRKSLASKESLNDAKFRWPFFIFFVFQLSYRKAYSANVFIQFLLSLLIVVVAVVMNTNLFHVVMLRRQISI